MSVPDLHVRLACSQTWVAKGRYGREGRSGCSEARSMGSTSLGTGRSAAPFYDHQPTILVTLETAVTALARIGYMPVVRLSTTTSPPGVVIVSDPLVLTNDNQWVAVGKVPVDAPRAKARFGALEAEAILFPQTVTIGGYRVADVASMFLYYSGKFKAIVIFARWRGSARLDETSA
jgi:hypothetical protein